MIASRVKLSEYSVSSAPLLLYVSRNVARKICFHSIINHKNRIFGIDSQIEKKIEEEEKEECCRIHVGY